MILRRLIVAAALSWMPASASAGGTPERVVGEFYDRFIHPRPSQYRWDDYLRVEELLGPELLRAMRTQREYEKACARLVPDGVKPYMLDQNPFYSGADDVVELLALHGRTTGKYAKVVVELGYGGGYAQGAVVVLRKDAGRWMIVEIQWPEGRSLTKELVAFARYRCTA